MTVEKVDTLIIKATNCEKGECSLDEVEILTKELQFQQKMVYDRIQQTTMLIDSLEHVNVQDSREVNEVRETVRAISRGRFERGKDMTFGTIAGVSISRVWIQF